MKDFLLNVAAELTATLFFTLIIAALSYIVYVYLYLKNRKYALRFFGIDNVKPTICIYVSTLNIKPGGTTGIEPIREGYRGAAITKLEYDGALTIQRELRAKPLALLPRSLQEWLGQESIELRTLDVPVKLSPPKLSNRDSVFDDNLIVLGTGVYNSLAHYYLGEYFEKHSDSYPWYFYHDKDKLENRIIGIRRKDFEDSPVVPGRSSRVEPAFIQRIYDIDCKTTVFICSGLGSSATYGSARYLSEHWRDLQRKFGNEEFGVMLLFYNQEPDGEFVGQPEIRYEGFLRRIPSNFV
ncbi:hypothetical protein IQ265_18685 [Nodosilinea sp. LEGE 06152]|uniref:hypothetical protein n=1 Tax=Nodosilinea sp. LEGE 06152 TaxID=2777966 RepID=UPI00187EBBD2|nr:hypothetical protein [Nodosilinea sp. LEGE 06152]MBE9158846.1 hypothetical protein [Nodosilinea sp. LEGE 06152]